MSQYVCFYRIYDQINPAWLSKRDLFKNDNVSKLLSSVHIARTKLF